MTQRLVYSSAVTQSKATIKSGETGGVQRQNQQRTVISLNENQPIVGKKQKGKRF